MPAQDPSKNNTIPAGQKGLWLPGHYSSASGLFQTGFVWFPFHFSDLKGRAERHCRPGLAPACQSRLAGQSGHAVVLICQKHTVNDKAGRIETQLLGGNDPLISL